VSKRRGCNEAEVIQRFCLFQSPRNGRRLPRDAHDLLPEHGLLTTVLRLQLGSMNSVASAEQVSLIHACGLLDHSVSNHLTWPCYRFLTLPLSSTGLSFRSRLRLSLADSPLMPSRIELATQPITSFPSKNPCKNFFRPPWEFLTAISALVCEAM
jgi:hypothetical protein